MKSPVLTETNHWNSKQAKTEINHWISWNLTIICLKVISEGRF